MNPRTPTHCIGQILKVQILKPKSDKMWVARVLDAEWLKGIPAQVYFREREPQPEAVLQAWVFGFKPQKGHLMLNADRYGRQCPKPSVRSRYVRALASVVAWTRYETEPDPDSFSEVKGLLNRCVRKDQSDWFLVWEALERPHISFLKSKALYLGSLSQEFRGKNIENEKKAFPTELLYPELISRLTSARELLSRI